VQVKPGDILLGDDSGALVIPAEKAEEVYRVAEEIAKKEEIIEREVRKGVSLREARAKMGYHALQTRK
jgi:regulator of RNase E activity RraA